MSLGSDVRKRPLTAFPARSDPSVAAAAAGQRLHRNGPDIVFRSVTTGPTHSNQPPPRPPRWIWAVPFPSKVPPLTRPQWKVLGLLSAAEFFDHYDMGIMSLALLQIQAGLSIPEESVGLLAGLVRLGAVPAFAFAVLADRMGRRRLLLITILGFTVSTFATSMVQTAEQFVALQFISRMFIYAETMLAAVVLAEELDAEHRGWGIGMLGALGALGHGLSAIVFGFVEWLPFGWRAMYAIGFLPMAFLAWFRRSLPETKRFKEQQSQRRDRGDWLDWFHPITQLVRMYPRRLAALCAAVFPLDFVIITAVTLMAKTLQEVHGYAPGEVTLLYIVGGAFGILGNLAAGVLSDRLGRRRVVVFLIVLAAFSFYGFYNLSGWIIVPIWIAQVFSTMGLSVLFKAMGSELFPTSYRSTAAGVRTIAGILGAFTGLYLEGPLYELTGSHAGAITLMLPILVIPAFVVMAFLPETATRELEDISPER